MSNITSATQARLCSFAGASFSRTIGKVDGLIGNGMARTPIIISVISSDPLFTATILGQANVSGTEVTQLSQAVLQLGMSMVQGLTRSLRPIPKERHALMSSYWSEANACSVMTRIIVAYRPQVFGGKVDDETARTAGLLHDLGMLVTALHFADGYDRALNRLRDGEYPLTKLLSEEVGAEPAAIAAQLSTLWQLPDMLAVVAVYFRRPTDAPRYQELCCAVHIARMLARGCGYCPEADCYIDPINDQSLEVLGLELTDFPRLLERFFVEMNEMEAYEPTPKAP